MTRLSCNLRRYVSGFLAASVFTVCGFSAIAQDLQPEWSGFTTKTLVTTGVKIPGTGRIGGIAADRFGYIYVANQDNGLWRITPTGKVEQFADGFYGSSGVIVMPDGGLLVGECLGHRISKVTRTGEVSPFATEGLRCPVGMTTTKDGRVFAINYMGGNIVEVHENGTTTEFARHDLLAQGNGLTSDPEGNLYAVSLGNGAVLKITPGGDVSELVTLPGHVNGHIAFASGMLFVTKLWEHVVVMVQMDGSYQAVSGNGVQGWQDGPGTNAQQSFPNGIWAFGDQLLVNNLRGGMSFSEDGSIEVRTITAPTERRVLGRAFDAGGIAELRTAYEWLKTNRGFTNARAVSAGEGIALGLLRKGHREAGLSLMEWVAADFPTTEALLSLGYILNAYGSRQATEAAFERVLEIDPDNEEAKRRLAGVRQFRVD